MTFKEFAKNPIVALLFMCVLAIGYLHVQHIGSLESTIDRLDVEIEQLKVDNKELQKQNKELRDIIMDITTKR